MDSSTRYHHILLKEYVNFREGKKWKKRLCIIKKPYNDNNCSSNNNKKNNDVLIIELYKKIKNNNNSLINSSDNNCDGHQAFTTTTTSNQLINLITKNTYKEKYTIELKTRIEMDKSSYLGLRFLTKNGPHSNILKILCKTSIHVFSLTNENSYNYWYHTITDNMGPEFQFEAFLIDNSNNLTSNNAKLVSQNVIIYIREANICLTTTEKTSLRVLKVWDIEEVCQFGCIDNKFIFKTSSLNNSSTTTAAVVNYYVLISDYSNEINSRLKHVLKEVAKKSRKKYTSANKIWQQQQNQLLQKYNNQRSASMQRIKEYIDDEIPYQHDNQYHFKINFNKNENTANGFESAESFLSLNNHRQRTGNHHLTKSKTSFQTSLYPATNSLVSFDESYHCRNNEDDGLFTDSDYHHYTTTTTTQRHHVPHFQQSSFFTSSAINNNNNHHVQQQKQQHQQQYRLSMRSESLNSALSRLDYDQYQTTDDYYDYQIPYSHKGVKEIKFSPIITINSENVFNRNKIQIHKEPPPPPPPPSTPSLYPPVRQENVINVDENNYVKLQHQEQQEKPREELHELSRNNNSKNKFLNKDLAAIVAENGSKSVSSTQSNCVQCKICKRNLPNLNNALINQNSEVGNNDKEASHKKNSQLPAKPVKRKTLFYKILEFSFRRNAKNNSKTDNKNNKITSLSSSSSSSNANESSRLLINKLINYNNNCNENKVLIHNENENTQGILNNIYSDPNDATTTTHNNNNDIICKHCSQIIQINKRKQKQHEDGNNNNNNKLSSSSSCTRRSSSTSSSSSSSTSSVLTYADIEKIRKKINHSQSNLNQSNSKFHNNNNNSSSNTPHSCNNYVKENDYTEIDVHASRALFDASIAHQKSRVQQQQLQQQQS